jgi:GNAT superfamily N-acetyltransferase
VPGPVRDIQVVTNGQLRSGEPLVELSGAKRAALLANPFLGDDDEPVRLMVVEGSQVAGRLDLVAGDLETPEGRIGCFWGSALHVDPAFRGKGLAAALLRESESFRPAAAACAPSRMSLPLYRRLGYLDLSLRRHVLIRNVKPLAHRRGMKLLADAANLGARAQRALLLGRRRRRATTERRSSFPPELEPQLGTPSTPFATCRPRAWIDWATRESFHADGHERALHLVSGESGDALGYFLVKTRRYSGVTRWRVENLLLGSLVDWRIFEPRALGLDDLVLLAVDALGEVDAVEICVPPGERSGLATLGFVPSGAQHLMVRRGDGGRLGSNPAEWAVRPGDGDHVFS